MPRVTVRWSARARRDVRAIRDYIAQGSTVVALTHTSLRHASVRHRRYGGEEKHAAEVLVLNDAQVLAGLAAS